MCRQCVVARRPLSSPACAKMNEPERGINRPSDQIVAAGDHDDVGGVDGRNAAGDRKPRSYRRRHIAPVDRCELERIICAEPVGFGEDLSRSRRVQQLYAVEDDHHHDAGSYFAVGHLPIEIRDRRIDAGMAHAAAH